MTIKRHFAVAGLIAAGALALSACGSDSTAPTANGSSGNSVPAPTNTAQVECGSKKLTAEGSSAQKGAMDVFIQAYGQKCAGQQLAYNPSGSGNGVSRFTQGQVDFGASDSALSAEKGEVDKAKTRCQGNPAWNLPLVFGPVAISYKLDGADELNLTSDVIAKIFSGAVKTWDDAAITAANNGKALPAKPIQVIYRGDDSGTTDNFQNYLGASAPSVWTKGAGKKFVGGTGQGAQGSAGVADAIGAADGTIGYIEWSYAQDKNLKMAKLNGAALTADTAAAAIKSAKVKGEGNDLVLDLKALYADKTQGIYPLVLGTYELVCSKGYDADTAKAVKAFLTVAATDAQAQLADAGYVPLPSDFQKKILDAIKAIA